MLKYIDFKPDEMTFSVWLRAFINHYLRYKFRRLIHIDSYSIIFKVPIEQLSADRNKAIQRVIAGMDFENCSVEKAEGENRISLYKSVFPWEANKFRKYFDHGSECFVYKVGEKITCYTWTSYGRIEPAVRDEFGYNLKIDKNDLWGIDIVVHPNYRGRGYEYLIFVISCDTLRERGIGNIYGAVSVLDRGSLKMHRRLGFKPVYLHHFQSRLGFRKSILYPIDDGSRKLAEKVAGKKGVDLKFVWK